MKFFDAMEGKDVSIAKYSKKSPKGISFRMCSVPDCKNQAVMKSGKGFVCGCHTNLVF